jgi:pimeloyl-ACP methyl ester carboxylesterase
LAERLAGPIPEPVPAERIEAPTLVIWGEDDSFLCKELTEDMEPLFSSRFEMKYVPGRGHWIQQEEPDLVNQYMLEFLADMHGDADPCGEAVTSDPRSSG